jgi:cysteine desulfuration protein SufE
MTQDKIQEEIIEEFSMFDDWLDKYDYIISLSESLPAIDPAKRTDKYLIEGCQSRVWVSSELEDGKMTYTADSDAIITKGIVALLVRVMNGRTAEEAAHLDLYFIDAIGLSENLSPTRSNGLRSMIQKMKLYAVIFTQGENTTI